MFPPGPLYGSVPLDSDETRFLEYLHELLAGSVGVGEARRRGGSGLRELSQSAFAFVRARNADQIRVRVETPGGSRSGRTVLEVLMLDQPFLVDTLRLTLARLGHRPLLLLHPALDLVRSDSGEISNFGKKAEFGVRESYLYAEIAQVEKPERLRIAAELRSTYAALRVSVEDYLPMVEALSQHAARIEACAKREPAEAGGAAEVARFLDWLADDHFLFLGYRACGASGAESAELRPATLPRSLGILRDGGEIPAPRGIGVLELPEPAIPSAGPVPLISYLKSSVESTFHRVGSLDCVRVAWLSDDASVVGYGLFVGVLTHKATRARGSEIPIARERRQAALEASAHAEPGSHRHKAAIDAFDVLPVECLLTFELRFLRDAIFRILSATERNAVEICVSSASQDCALLVSIIAPIDLHDEEACRSLEGLLRREYLARCMDRRTVHLDDEFVLIHFLFNSPKELNAAGLAKLEQACRAQLARWEDSFEVALGDRYSEADARRLAEEYGSIFPDPYRGATSAREAAGEVPRLERLRSGEACVEVALYEHYQESEPTLKVYQRERPYLTDLLPILDDFGIRVIDAMLTELRFSAENSAWVVAFRIDPFDEESGPERNSLVIEGLVSALRGRVEADALNALTLVAGLGWREIDLLRAYLSFALQCGSIRGRVFASEVLVHYPDSTQALIDLFRARFDPDLEGERGAIEEAAISRIEAERRRIPTVDEDRIFRIFENLIQSTVRNDFYTEQKRFVHQLSFKLDSSRVEELPAPRPYREIFVHSVDQLGVHLRGGRVARGGVRWSDRASDVRTEVLGLMKAQMVKNGLIVPVGSKGGFVLKRRFDAADEARAEAERQYECYIDALLGITDNVVDGITLHPERVVCHDGEDAYLVVAPDRGTGHLSDRANRIASEKGFWLGDAFASGGSRGFSHKKEGITARGAWLCAVRHFREAGVDVNEEPFTISGIGDMSGDVFGNGLLLARTGRLLAAFDDKQIFLDPDPDLESSWRERARLFELESSTWRDYRTSAISTGGGIFERNARSISLSREARGVLDVNVRQLSGEDLVRAILKMPVDLLWNGGIGTYVKASTESNDQVGDLANARVRVDASEIRARVVAEGGNLGFTQLARVEYAIAGGRINTDAIDNSGGVDLSDHEVNYKILMAEASRMGQCSSEERDELLYTCVKETDEIVLAHSIDQSRCISLDLARGIEQPSRIFEAVEFLERHAVLDPELELLPSPDELGRRLSASGSRVGFSRPEISVLLGYTKMLVRRELLRSSLPDHPEIREAVRSYFPRRLRERFDAEIDSHPLRREIAASILTNAVIDRAGVTLVPELVQLLRASIPDVVAGYWFADRMLDAEHALAGIWASEVSEDARLRASRQVATASRSVARFLVGLERPGYLEPREAARWLDLVSGQRSRLREALAGSEAVEARCAEGFERDLGLEIATLQPLSGLLGAFSIAVHSELSVDSVAVVHERIGHFSCMDLLVERLASVQRSPGWEGVAAAHLLVEMLDFHRSLTRRTLERGLGEEALPHFLQENTSQLQVIAETVRGIADDARAGLAALTVLSQQIRRLC